MTGTSTLLPWWPFSTLQCLFTDFTTSCQEKESDIQTLFLFNSNTHSISRSKSFHSLTSFSDMSPPTNFYWNVTNRRTWRALQRLTCFRKVDGIKDGRGGEKKKRTSRVEWNNGRREIFDRKNKKKFISHACFLHLMMLNIKRMHVF